MGPYELVSPSVSRGKTIYHYIRHIWALRVTRSLFVELSKNLPHRSKLSHNFDWSDIIKWLKYVNKTETHTNNFLKYKYHTFEQWIMWAYFIHNMGSTHNKIKLFHHPLNTLINRINPEPRLRKQTTTISKGIYQNYETSTTFSTKHIGLFY